MTTKELILLAIATVAHEVNRAYCLSLGDQSVVPWADAAQAQRDSILAGVQMHLDNPNQTPEESHQAWLDRKVAEGWAYAEAKDTEKKQHPCILPYDQLPPEQKSKDYLFRGVVHATHAAIQLAGNDAFAAGKLAAKEEAQDLAQKEATNSPLSITTAPVVIKAGQAAVEYIGRKEVWVDTLYGSSLSFTKNQVRVVPLVLAGQFLRHQDMFKEGVIEPEPLVVSAPESPDDTEETLRLAVEKKALEDKKQHEQLDLRDQVNIMNEEALIDFAQVKFNQKLPKNMKIENMRNKVLGLIDQFGVV